MEKSNFGSLLNQAKASKKQKVIQKVVPVKTKDFDEVQFSFYIEKETLKQLKIKAIEEDKSIKILINQGIKNVLEIK